MSLSSSSRAMLLLVLISVIMTGCNAFESFDRNLNDRDHEALLDEANLRLDAADYIYALDLFDRVINEGGASDESYRGRASARAGLAGFNMFAVLNALQNGVSTTDSSAVIFSAAKLVTDLDLLNSAIEDMNRLLQPGNEDKLFRSIMAILSASKSLIQKYDTNLNKKLDTPDQIDFDTQDAKTPRWPDIYQRLTSSSSPFSIEKAYIELARSFDGRGTQWITISPINGITYTGTYTPANRNVIIASGNFADILENANARFDNSATEFKNLLLSLDGAN
ncbi:MAG: hypothetical protein PHV05_03995 [Candidatus Riflebacteria bacterium]|nr:hypothetical protein [Candidatus Riflebacteria bacterium]